MPFISVLYASNSDNYGSGLGEAVVFLIFFALALYLYVLPSIIAYKNSKDNRFIILLINIFFGGTGLGWLVALALALSGNEKKSSQKRKK
jgi:RsiW-degrading membrane proteinase PrsW (M82 family)